MQFRIDKDTLLNTLSIWDSYLKRKDLKYEKSNTA